MRKNLSLILAIIMIAAVICTAIPFAAFAADEDPTIIKIYTGVGSEKGTEAVEIKKSMLITDFAAWANGLKTHIATYDTTDITVEFVADVDLADKPIHFIAPVGKTLDIIGNGHTVSSSVDPAIRLSHNDNADVNVNVKNLKVNKAGGNGAGFQLYNGRYTFDGCEIVTANHYPIVTYANTVELTVTNTTLVGRLQNAGTATFTLGAGTVIDGSAKGTSVYMNAGTLTVDGATLTGTLDNSKGATVTLTSGTLNGAIKGNVTKADGFTVNAPAETTPVETTPVQNPGTSSPTDPKPAEGNPTDVIVEIFETGSTTVLKTVTRADFLTAFKLSNDILKTDSALAGKNLTLEFKNDVIVPDGDDQIGFTAAADTTVTINGNGHLIYGGKGGNPAFRAYGPGKFVFNKLNVYHKGGSCIQFYSSATLDINECEWTTPDHYVFYLTGGGTVNVNDKTTLTGSCVFYYSASGPNIINVNKGSTVKGTGPNTIWLVSKAAAAEINLLGGDVISAKEDGNVINVASDNFGNLITVNGSALKGDVVGTLAAIITFESGSLEGQIDENIGNAIIYDGFVLNGVAYVDTSVDVTDSTPAETDPVETDPIVTTPEATDPAGDVTTPEATDPAEDTAPAGGCGGIAVAAQLVALICAAAAIIIIKKK